MKSCDHSVAQYCPPDYVDNEDSLGNVISGDWRSEAGQTAALAHVRNMGGNRYSRSAEYIRDTFKNYFVSPQGEIEWQYSHVRGV